MSHTGIQRFYEQLGRPIAPKSRWLLALAVVPLLLGAIEPLWTIRMSAPQYPKGLRLDIYTYQIAGGNDGRDLPEINTLNHYVGMRKLDPAQFADLDFLPFAIGALGLLALRVAAIGDLRSLVDLVVLTLYLGLFGLSRFAWVLYSYGHRLDPKAPIAMPGFMPPMIGSRQIANFSVSGFPNAGTALITLFGVVVVLVGGWHVVRAVRGEPAS